LDVLIPTCGRPAALAVTLAGLANQSAGGFRVIVSDQSPTAPSAAASAIAGPAIDTPEVRAMARRLRRGGHRVDLHHGHPRRGMAEHRQFLLDLAGGEHVLFLDDDVFLDASTIARMLAAIGELRCGFVGCAPQGLSYLDDVRPHEWTGFEAVRGPVRPERVRKGGRGWERWRLHNAANPAHLAERVTVPARGWLAYRVTWIAGCVLYDRAVLVDCGGFEFWRRLPASHRGEEIVAQLRVMERAGGVGLLPSGAQHLELPTSVVARDADAYAEIIETDDRDRDHGGTGTG
jgi:GT2 family glycosyltransferase